MTTNDKKALLAAMQKENEAIRNELPTGASKLSEAEQIGVFFLALKRLRPKDYNEFWGYNLDQFEEFKNRVFKSFEIISD